MPDLSAALNADPLKFQDKAVKSVRSRVTNISEHLKEPMDVLQFADHIQDHIAGKYPDARFYDLTEEDHRKINELARSKYETWDWNFGYSPNYNFKKIFRTEKSGTIEIDLDVHDGIIRKIRIYGDYFGKYDTEEIEAVLTGAEHQEEAIRAALKRFDLNDYFLNLNVETFILGFF
jgi:lipoate-protein ligase A